MVGEFILRCLMLIFGYAYPALKCYKTLEKNKVDMEELRFWCKYWVIVAILTVFERTGDIFISWLPFYGDMKLAFVIYLWHPKTRGTNNVYDGLLTPYVANHETDLEHKLLEWKTRALDLAIFYGRDCSQLGHAAFFQVIQFLASQTSKFTNDDTKRKKQDSPSLLYNKPAEEESEASKKQAGYGVYTTIPETEQFDDVEGHVPSEVDQVNNENELPISPQNHLSQKSNQARLRRSKAERYIEPISGQLDSAETITISQRKKEFANSPITHLLTETKSSKEIFSDINVIVKESLSDHADPNDSEYPSESPGNRGNNAAFNKP